jgi:hypothetical protein
MSDRNVVTLTILAVLTAFVLGVMSAGWSVYGPTDQLTEKWAEHTGTPGVRVDHR